MLKKSASIRKMLFGLSCLFGYLVSWVEQQNKPDEPDKPTEFFSSLLETADILLFSPYSSAECAAVMKGGEGFLLQILLTASHPCRVV
jgi:hypothetical protein